MNGYHPSGPSSSGGAANGSGGGGTQWSGLETPGMIEAKCSLLVQEDGAFDPRIKSLPKQRVLVYQDRGYNPATTTISRPQQQLRNGENGIGREPNSNEENFFVDFNGCTILQLEPAPGTVQRTMPITLTVGGRCIFTPENYQDFRVMMRTKEQSDEMDIAPNGNFDWPDVQSLMLCPLCGNKAEVPKEGDDYEHEYWLIFYPLLQITVMKGSQMTLGTRTICRLTCLDCMEDLLEDMTLKVRPAAMEGRRPKLSFTLPANEVLSEAGSASFLEDGPPRPETHPHVDDILDAWTLYNLWEHSGAWEALQNDYRIVLSRSMHTENGGIGDGGTGASAGGGGGTSGAEHASSTGRRSGGGSGGSSTVEARLRDRHGKSCGNPTCHKVHGRRDPETGDMTQLSIRCKQCHVAYYCSRTCREDARDSHREQCLLAQEERAERREKKAKQVTCDTCGKRSSYTKMKKCSRCRNATYCSVECQKEDWNRHKLECQKRLL
jgi:MYND finger